MVYYNDYSWGDNGTSCTISSSSAWDYWNTGFQVRGDGITSDATWTYWTSGSTQTISADEVWVSWVSDCGNTTIRIVANPPELSSEERARQAEAARLAREEQERLRQIQIQEKAEADERALELLQDLLTEDEFAFYQKHGRLLVKGRQYDYLIQKDSGTVVRLEKDKVADLCMHLDDHHAYSRHDNVIAMKLYLEGKEEEFNREANLHRHRPPQGVEAELLRVVNG